MKVLLMQYGKTMIVGIVSCLILSLGTFFLWGRVSAGMEGQIPERLSSGDMDGVFTTWYGSPPESPALVREELTTGQRVEKTQLITPEAAEIIRVTDEQGTELAFDGSFCFESAGLYRIRTAVKGENGRERESLLTVLVNDP